MTISSLHYDLLNGFIQNWLVAGPQADPVEKVDGIPDPTIRQEITKNFYVPALEIKIQPVERGKLTEGVFTIGDYQGSWEYYRCQEDHLVNHSGCYSSIRYLRSWAYTQLECKKEIDVQLRLTSSGVADLWVNHKHLLRKELSESQYTAVTAFHLSRGTNKIYLRFENLAVRDCAHFAALQICTPDGTPLSDPENVSVCIPTVIMPRLLEMRNHLEQLFAEISLEQDAIERDQEIVLHLPDDPCAAEVVTIRLMNPDRVIFRDGAIEGKPAQRISLNSGYELTGGRYQIELLPRVWEYYDLDLRIKKDIPVWTVGNAPYNAELYGSYAERCQEALLKAIEQGKNLYAEMAKMALNLWSRLDLKTISAAVDQVNLRLDGSILQLAALIGILYRFSGNPQFPEEIRPILETCLKNYRYRQDEPGYDAQNFASGWAQILFHACELLAGQRFPDENFLNSGQTGREHAQKAAELARSWILERAQLGFDDWGSNEGMTYALIALSLLADLTEDQSLQELAVVLMDKIFFSLALNTYRGILGAPQKDVSPTDLKGGILQPTAGITRLMWGMGVFNHRIEGYVSLACMEQYELPGIISDIATNIPEEMWSREQHAPSQANESGSPVNKVAYRTPDYMISSAQDYRPGASGGQEHIWQATFDPSAIVFVNNPGCSFQEKGMTPGYWVGNAHLPRVAQWKNALVTIYNLPEDDWMGFTHAYFPTHAFDEYEIRGQWAFARKGSGYLAITSSSGIQLITQGPQTLKELRAQGRQVIWVCQMGRAAQDGDFSSFKQKILELPLQYDRLSVRFTTIQGEELSFGYEGPFLCNESEVPLHDFPHYDNPYSVTPLNAGQMDIVYNDSVLRLDFSAQPEE